MLRLSYMRIVFFILFFPAAVTAQTKLGMDLIKPSKKFSMSVGETLEIEFNAITSVGQFYYAIVLKHADEGPWKNGAGPLFDKPKPLKQGSNKYLWDGISFFDEAGSKLMKLKERVPGQYYINIYIFDSNQDIRMVGDNTNYYIQKIMKLRTKNFNLK